MNIVIALIGLFFSFIFAGSESAFNISNKLRLEVWYRRKLRYSSHAYFFVRHPEHFFSTILVGNNLANILCTTFATVYLIQYIDETLAMLIISAVILLFGEIIPKSLFLSLADRLILHILLFVRSFYFILKPVIHLINLNIEAFLSLIRVKHDHINRYYSREEFEILLRDESMAENKIEQEYKYIENLLSFSQTRVREVMTPRIDMKAIGIESGIDDIIQVIQNSDDNFVIVYESEFNDRVGVIFAQDILRETGDLKKLIKPIMIVPENKKCYEILKEFQQARTSVALVVDEHGSTAGVVTMDDLIEDVFGYFLERTEALPEIKRINKNTWLCSGSVDLDTIMEITGIEIPMGDYETIAGFLLNYAGTIPEKDEIFNLSGFRIKIIDATPQKILKVQLTKELA
ncbi:MAG: HlyC/CorC family transporter [Calditrichaceae bacterium]|nr:HlyC/CorC family transporter [Calditrichaceae bacterium]MBN2709373.1 HlyC/CorC family transporter [Calditrichaceae bacterium]RQV95747.1 MAG: HlyC/CorC family transporter [Calditrichota bacterium]